MQSRLWTTKKCEFFIIYWHQKHCVSSNCFFLLFFPRNTKSKFPILIKIGNTSKHPVQFILRHRKQIPKSWCRIFNFICNRNGWLKVMVTVEYVGNLTWHKQTDVNAKFNVPKLSKIETSTVQGKKSESQKLRTVECAIKSIACLFECVFMCVRFCSQCSIGVVLLKNIHALFLLISYVQGIN